MLGVVYPAVLAVKINRHPIFLSRSFSVSGSGLVAARPRCDSLRLCVSPLLSSNRISMVCSDDNHPCRAYGAWLGIRGGRGYKHGAPSGATLGGRRRALAQHHPETRGRARFALRISAFFRPSTFGLRVSGFRPSGFRLPSTFGFNPISPLILCGGGTAMLPMSTVSSLGRATEYHTSVIATTTAVRDTRRLE